MVRMWCNHCGTIIFPYAVLCDVVRYSPVLYINTQMRWNREKLGRVFTGYQLTHTLGRKMKVETCSFSQRKIYPSKGKLYVRGDSKVCLLPHMPS